MKPDYGGSAARADSSCPATTKPCLICNKGHNWLQCDALKKATDPETLSFLKKNSLFLVCGGNPHGSNNIGLPLKLARFAHINTLIFYTVLVKKVFGRLGKIVIVVKIR